MHSRVRIGRLALIVALPVMGMGCPSDPPAGDPDGTGTTQSTPGSTSTMPDPGSTSMPMTGDGTTADTTHTPTETGTTAATTSGTSGTTETAGTTEDTEATTTGMGACPYEAVMGMPAMTLELVAEGFDRPVLAIGHPTEPDRLFVVEQGGNVRILEPGEVVAPASSFLFLDVDGAGNTTIGAEFGLLGFAFHPDFPVDPRVYVDYNPPTPGATPLRTVISEFTLDPGNPDQVDPTSERVILELEQPAMNHNGGMIGFGPDGYLYIGMGDGGGAGNTFETARNPSVLLSKILRIDVEPDGQPDDPVACVGCTPLGPFDYTIPPSNPFVGDAAFAPEIYAWGMRNPWRFAWDSVTRLLYTSDPGQNNWEEVSLIEAGADLGWSTMEGFHCFGGALCDDTAGPNQVNAQGMTMPLLEYGTGLGAFRCAVVGGAVYRSCEVPAWDGVYLYSDYCTGELFGLQWDGVTVTDLGVLLDHDELPTGNGWNAYGDVFITTVDAILGGPIFDGRVYRVAPSP